MRERTREGRRETRPTAADRLAAKLATQRGEDLSGGEVARMPAEARRRLLMRLDFLSGRASAEELRAALAGEEEPPRPATARGHGRDRSAGEDESPPLNEAGPRGDRKAIDRDGAEPTRRTTVLPPVRVSDGELAEIRRLAARAGVSVSEWVRTRSLGVGATK